MDTIEIDETREKIIEQLELLNAKMERQHSFKHILATGIIYGIGFFIGSAILATITLGILSPWLAEIDWLRNIFERGASIVD